MFDRVLGILDGHLDEVAARLAGEQDVIGLTTSFGQLFANLALASRLKRLDPRIVVVLGGSTVSSRVGVSILTVYPQVDYVIQGEGEQPLLALLEALGQGASPRSGAGLLARDEDGRPPSAPAPLSEVATEVCDTLLVMVVPQQQGEWAAVVPVQ